MKIGLIDVDWKTNFPNLALMKISKYYRKLGHKVEWVSIDNYDKTYISKVFTYTQDFLSTISNLGEIIKGGTGYNFKKKLPYKIDCMVPDYSIYPKFRQAYGFLTRGCINNCDYCIVPKKEGYIRGYADIESFLDGRKEAILMDNNVLACEHGIKQIEKIIKLKIKVDFNQGLDSRIIVSNKKLVNLLSKVKWIRYIRLACDNTNQIKNIDNTIKMFNKVGIKNYKFFIYVLLKEKKSGLEIINYLRKKKVKVFAQPYRDYKTNNEPNVDLKKIARWCNHTAIFNKIEFKDYSA